VQATVLAPRQERSDQPTPRKAVAIGRLPTFCNSMAKTCDPAHGGSAVKPWSGSTEAGDGILLSDHMDSDDPAMFRHACAMGLEGDRLEAARPALPVGPMPGLDQGQKPERAPRHVSWNDGSRQPTMSARTTPTPADLMRRSEHPKCAKRPCRCRSAKRPHYASSSSSALASFKSSVSKPSVNQPYTGARRSWACCRLP